MNKKNYIVEIVILLGLTFIFSILNIRICPFFYLFKIPCPGCGLTRSIRSLLNGDIIGSFKYNIIGIPLVVCSIIYFIFFIFKKEYLIDNFLRKNKMLVIIIAIFIMIVAEIINIYNPKLY